MRDFYKTTRESIVATQRIRINLKSYDHILIDKSADRIVTTVKNTGAVISGPVPLPTRRSVYTVTFPTRKKSRVSNLRREFIRDNRIFSSIKKQLWL